MAITYNEPPAVVTGQVMSATNWNDWVVGVFKAIWVFTAGGQIAYSTAGNQLEKLNNPAAVGLLAHNGSIPAWLTGGNALQALRKNAANNGFEFADMSVVSKRQGGDATNWDSPGTTNYAPTAGKVQIGAATITMAGNPGSGFLNITFPDAFSAKPLVWLTVNDVQAGGVWYQLGFSHVANTGFRIWMCYNGNSATYGNRIVNWIAMGAP